MLASPAALVQPILVVPAAHTPQLSRRSADDEGEAVGEQGIVIVAAPNLVVHRHKAIGLAVATGNSGKIAGQQVDGLRRPTLSRADQDAKCIEEGLIAVGHRRSRDYLRHL